MTQEQFDALVERLEIFARQQPINYKLRVGLLAALGYGYISLLLAGLMLIFALQILVIIISPPAKPFLLIVWVILANLPAFIILLPILRSLLVHMPPPTGLELSRQKLPHLFTLIDELTSALKAPQFHRILLTDEFNAAVVQIPRLGIFGWQQNYLILGLPLMQALSPMQFRAVLAHELGHLSGNHNYFAGWIYRVRKTYSQLLSRLQQSGHKGSSALVERFFNWYAPFFSAYSFVLGRMDEYEADRCAVELAGMQNTAEALINVEVKAKFLESSFWPSIYKQINHQIEPPTATFTTMFTALRNDVKSEDATRWFDQGLARKTSTADTHPCLADRLSALGYVPIERQLLSEPVKVSAAREFLGGSLKQLTQYFDCTWKEKMSSPWRQRYAYAQEAQKNLQAMDEKAKAQPLTADEVWNRACWTAEFKGNEVASLLFQEILATQPDHAAANYALGQILLQQHDAKGISYIEQAMDVDLDSVIPGCDLIYSFWAQQGQTEAASAYQQRADQHYELVIRAQSERSDVKASDTFQPHNLPSEALQMAQLSRLVQLKQAYLVQKVVQYFPQKPFYVLAVIRHRGFFELSSYNKDKKLFTQLANEFSSNTYIIFLNNDTKNLEKKLRKIEGAAIYPKKRNNEDIRNTA